MSSSNINIVEMELRQQTLEKEMSVLKDTVWRLTGRIYVLETFLGEKFDEVIVDFGMKLSLSLGGQANFLHNAMQANLISTKSQQQQQMNTSTENGPSPPPVGANITISHRSVDEEEKQQQSAGVPLALTTPIGLVTRGQQESSGSSGGDGNRNAITTTSRISCKAEPSRSSGENDNYQAQSDFNVEEFVVFPQVPEFILGTEVQNGSAESLMAGSESSTEESEDQTVESLRRNSESTSAGSSLNNPRRNRQYKCVPCSKFFTSEWHLKAHLIKHADGVLISGGQHHHHHQEVSVSATSGEVVPVTVQGTQVIQIPGGQVHQHQGQGQDSSSSSGDPQLQKPFACVYCGKRFKKRQELTVHLRIHTGEKPFKCPVCDRGFSQSSSMKTHLRIHTGEKKFKCEFCKSCFTVMHNYKKHLQSCHQIDDFA